MSNKVKPNRIEKYNYSDYLDFYQGERNESLGSKFLFRTADGRAESKYKQFF